ncbi:MAG TPA: COX15/CtaA family protein [Ohtaekwangia sp.]|uniref:COX15/CtaA family protein n=1 Tax=Ohtaekwangia sp. TaxID=2066019 RepID=UPI002F928139
MRSFRRLTIATLVAVYVLILVGGIVRSTGSGMGCPDWPKCFGNWVPPKTVADLPANYKDIYASYREKKNVRFAKYLNALGMEDTAQKLLNDPSVLAENDFNPTKTWIEYFNRIVGVIIGFLILAVFISSIRFWKTETRLTVIALLSFLLVSFQGWIGSFVVSTNLTPWTITVHMFLALLIVALLVYLIHRSSYATVVNSTIGFWWLVVCMAVLLVQTLLGTQVREAIDRVASWASREEWVANLGVEFVLHRSFSWIVLVLHVGLILNLRKTEGSKVFLLTLIVLILGTILTGAGMAYFAVPPYLQPVHLLLATATFGMQFMLLLKLNRKEEPVVIN